MNEFTIPLAETIKNARTGAELTQAQVAERAGVEPASIMKMENPFRNANPELSTLWPVVRVLNIDLSDIFYPGRMRDNPRIKLLQQMVGECSDREADALIPVIKELIRFMRFNSKSPIEE